MLFLVGVELVLVSEPLPAVGTDEGKGLYGGHGGLSINQTFSAKILIK
jgi:hypothetical protein